jgi:histidine triad (HIT) family protein
MLISEGPKGSLFRQRFSTVPWFPGGLPAQAVGLLVARLSRALKDAAGADHVYVFFYGDHVPHLHLHVFARYPGTPEEYWRQRVDEWPGSPKGSADEVAAFCDRLRSALASTAA